MPMSAKRPVPEPANPTCVFCGTTRKQSGRYVIVDNRPNQTPIHGLCVQCLGWCNGLLAAQQLDVVDPGKHWRASVVHAVQEMSGRPPSFTGPFAPAKESRPRSGQRKPR